MAPEKSSNWLNTKLRKAAHEMDKRLRAFTSANNAREWAESQLADAKNELTSAVAGLSKATEKLEESQRAFCELLCIGLAVDDLLAIVRAAIGEWNEEGGSIKFSPKTFAKRLSEIQQKSTRR